jgi:ribosomal protein S17
MRQNFIGMVVGNAMQKTIKVKVTSQKIHPIVMKVIFLFKKKEYVRSTSYLHHYKHDIGHQDP